MAYASLPGSRESAPQSDNKHIRAGFTESLGDDDLDADLVRAVMEGVAANSAWLFGYVEKFAGRTLSPVRLVGGGAQSALWCQIYADTLDREVEQVSQPLLAQARGAALLAAVALKRRRLRDVVASASGGRFQPSSDAEATLGRARQLPGLYERDKRWSRRHPNRT